MESLFNQTEGSQDGGGDEEDPHPFELLPDELIISHIFDKIYETKSLFLISLVSKHFSSLVFQTHDVFLKIPLQNPYHHLQPNNNEQPAITNRPLSLPGKVLRFITTPLRLVRGSFSSILQRSSRSPPPLSITSESVFFSHIPVNFLAKFTSMRSFYLEYDNSGPGLITSKKEPLVKWTIHNKTSAFILLYGRNILDLDDDSQDYESFISNENDLLAHHFDYHMEVIAFRFKLLEKLIPLLPESLKKVVITDSKKQGKLDFGEDDVAELRNGYIDFGDLKKGRFSIRCWFAPWLILPLSGCALKMVALFLCKDSESGYDDFLIAKEAFDGEDKEVFAQAATELMKKEVIYERILSVED